MNIRNTMCRLSDLTQEQIDSLVEAMPDSDCFDFYGDEPYVGVNVGGDWGTWTGGPAPSIVTYTEMMQLLGKKDMNKKTAQEQMTALQVEMDKLKAIIDKPEVKAGRVLSLDDLELKAEYWFTGGVADRGASRTSMDNDVFDKASISTGSAFHDKESAWQYVEYLKLEQELRVAQAADGGVRLTGKRFTTILYDNDVLINEVAHSQYAKISFNSQTARASFRTTHTDEQLILLIRGV